MIEKIRGMNMEHKEYIHISDNKKTVVLMIHGILGTPRHFDAFLDVIPNEWSIYNILLDGHGREVEDLSKTSMKKWKKQVLKTVSKLEKEYEEIVITGHSMGTLLAIMASIAFPDKIKYMFLLNVPLYFHLHPVVIKNAYKIVFCNEKRDFSATSMKMAGSIRITRRLWKYLGWIPRYLELFHFIRQTREHLHLLKVPVYAFQSTRDELVSNRSIPYLDVHPYITNQILQSSGHFGYSPEDMQVMKDTMRRVIRHS